MNLEIIIAAGFNTPDLLAKFLLLDVEKQDEIYRAAAEKSDKVSWFCDLSEKQETT